MKGPLTASKVTAKTKAREILDYCDELAEGRESYLQMVWLLGVSFEIDISLDTGDLHPKTKETLMLTATYLQRYACQALGISKKTAMRFNTERTSSLRKKDFSVFDMGWNL